MHIIEVNNLSKTFDYYEKEQGFKGSLKNVFRREKLTKEAVSDISFQVEEGEIVGFLGPNGAGKTTTLKMLSGILFPTSGHALVGGYVPWERKKQYKMSFSIVMGQKTQLWWDLPASESLYLNKCIYELSDTDYRKTVEELADTLEVKKLLNVQVRRLSLGERMKMELIASLLHKPKIMFLDEPTIGLDVVSQRKIREFLRYYNEQTKTTVILTSHYMKDIEALCGRTLVIGGGKIVYDGSLSGLGGRFGGGKLLKITFGEPVPSEVLSRFGRICEHGELSVTLEVEKNKVNQCARRMLETLPVTDFTVEEMPIEEAVAKLYSGTSNAQGAAIAGDVS